MGEQHTKVDEKAIRVRFFGEGGAVVHGEAIYALHKFAQLTNCPAGHDVIGWFSHMTAVWQDACARQARAASEGGRDG